MHNLSCLAHETAPPTGSDLSQSITRKCVFFLLYSLHSRSANKQQAFTVGCIKESFNFFVQLNCFANCKNFRSAVKECVLFDVPFTEHIVQLVVERYDHSHRWMRSFRCNTCKTDLPSCRKTVPITAPKMRPFRHNGHTSHDSKSLRTAGSSALRKVLFSVRDVHCRLYSNS